MSPLLQTLPVGSLVFSVLATDKDTGSAGVVQYFIEEVSVGPATPHDHQGQRLPHSRQGP